MISADSGFGSSWGGAQVTKLCLSHCLAGRGHGFHHNSGSCHPCSRPRLKSAIIIIIGKIFTRIVLHLCRSQRKSFFSWRSAVTPQLASIQQDGTDSAWFSDGWDHAMPQTIFSSPPLAFRVRPNDTGTRCCKSMSALEGGSAAPGRQPIIYIYTYIHNIYIHVCVYIYTHIYIHIHIYIWFMYDQSKPISYQMTSVALLIPFCGDLHFVQV